MKHFNHAVPLLSLISFLATFDPAQAGILASTHGDYSIAAQGTAGFQYGYYTGVESTVETAGTAEFSTAGETTSGSAWLGNAGGNTPAHLPIGMHPGLAGGGNRNLNSVVRRYTLGPANGESAPVAPVRIVGRFFSLGGSTSGFVTLGGTDLAFGPQAIGDVPFDFTSASLTPDTTIDLGIKPDGSGSSDWSGMVAWIVSGDTAVPTNVLANTNTYSAPNPLSGARANNRGLALIAATDGVIGGTVMTSFDTGTGAGFPYQFVGLLYLEQAGSGKAARFDSVRVDMMASGDYSDTPRLYLLRQNLDLAASNPAADDRYVKLPVAATRIASNSAGQPAYTFDLSGLPAGLRTGYGFAVVGAGIDANTPISVSEINAAAVRVADSEVIAPQPFFVGPVNGHRYGLSTVRGNWEQVEASAVGSGGHLLALNSPSENGFITDSFGYTETFFIGLRQNTGSGSFSEPAGGFEWVNGDPVTFENWHGPAAGGSEPNNFYGAGEDYAMMGYFHTPSGTWGDVRTAGYPETSDYRGIIELPTAGTGERNFQLPGISAKSNIFDAGLASPTQGGTLPPFIDVSGYDGQPLTFPQIVGEINTAVDRHGPDGKHTPGRSCELTSVGGISGYLNGNNTPALVGVFLGAAQPATAPARLDFSTNAIGENFTTLAPALGQVFFIGDGATSGGIAQQFTVPAGATRLFFGVPDGNNGTLYHGAPLGYGDNSGTISLRASLPTLSVPVPEITVRQPMLTELLDDQPVGADFGDVLVGAVVVKTFTIENTGNAPLNLGTITRNGTHQSDFTVAGPASSVILPGGNTSFTVTFTAGALGTRTAAIHLPSDDADENPFDIALTGRGTAPEIAIEHPAGVDLSDNSPGSLNFGNPGLGVSVVKTFTIRNPGDATLNIGVIAKNGTHAGDFTISGPLSSAIPPGGDTTFTVTFITAGAGPRTAAIHIPSDDADESPFDVNLIANGAATEIDVEEPVGSPIADSGPAIAFGSHLLSVNVVKTFTIRNPSSANLYLGTFVKNGTHPGDFIVNGPALSTILPGGNTTFTVTFAAGGLGIRTAAIHIPSDDADESPFDINLTGVGVAPEIAVEEPAASSIADSGAAIAFGSHQLNVNAVKTFTIRNLGGATLDLGAITKNGTHQADFTVSGPVTSTLAPNASTTFTVTFAATAVGTRTAAIHIASNDADENPFDINLTGGGTAIPVPEIVVEQPAGTGLTDAAGTVDFGVVEVLTSATRTFTIRNTGSADLTGLVATVTGDFNAGTLAATTLAPNASTTLTVTFNPTIQGARAGVLQIASNDANENPFDINLSGVGFDAGSPPVGILASTHSDFSTAAQGTAGFQYGFYASPDATTGAFSIANMTVVADANGNYWGGNEGGTTPANDYRSMHPGGALSPSVRRYTVGSGGEPAFTGPVRIVGRFFDLNNGNTNVFIAVDPDGDGGAGARTLVLPASAGNPTPGIEPVRGQQGVSFDFTTYVTPGTTIDFGALALGSYNSDSTGLYAWIVSDDTPVPTHLLANSLGSLDFPTSQSLQETRGLAFTMVTDGVVSGTDLTSVDTSPGTGVPYQFAGLLYRENAGNGKATRFDSVRIDVMANGDFSDTPRFYLLRHNSDPASSNPALDDRYARMPVVPLRAAANSAGQPYYTFDLTGLSPAQRTGYGFAVVGFGSGANGAIALSEISASAVRAADTAVIAPQPFLVLGPDNHRYGFGVVRGDWDQVEASAVASGGHLLALNSSSENEFINATFGYSEVFFIGLRQIPGSGTYSEPAGGFEWVSGDPVTFVNWHGPAFGGSEPNNSAGVGEDYAMMGYFQNPTGTWGDVTKAGYPETSNFRGIIELENPDAEEMNFYLPAISAKSNIFDAGLAAATQGGVLPPSINLTGFGGQIVTFPQIGGVINTAADLHGPDGAHTAGRSCDLSSVGGISGYRNGNNTPALVGVFLGAAQPATAPATLDFSTNALGENFTSLAPVLGQVFFIGDGFTSGGIAQQFTIPAGATRLFFGVPDGNNGTLYHGTPLGYGDNTGVVSLRASLLPGDTPTIVDADFPLNGGLLDIFGGNGPYTVTILSGSLPPGLSISSTGIVIGTAGNGVYQFTLRVIDAFGVSSDRAFSGTIENPITLPGGMLAWWPGEGAVGEIIGGHHVAVATGSQSYVAGKVGQAFSFNGIDQSATTTVATELMNQVPLTIEGWVKPGARSSGSINDPLPPNVIGNDQVNLGGHGFGVHIYPDGSKLNIGVQGQGIDFRNIPGVTFLPDEWVHIAVVYSPGQAKTYVNGQLVDTVSYIQAPMEGSPVVRIGRHNDDTGYGTRRFFKGAIDELSLYGRALGDAEITAIHLASAGGKARHDVARDFSKTANNGPVWSYRWLSSSASLAPYAPAAAASNLLGGPTRANGIDSWGGPSYVSHNSSDTSVVIPSAGYQYDWTARQIGMSPGAASEFAVVRWTAPRAGRYAVSGTFFGSDTRPSSVDVHIFHNAAELSPVDKRAVNSYRGNGVSHTESITVAENDTVDFIVGAGGNGYSYDSSGLAASVAFLAPAGPDLAFNPNANNSVVCTAVQPNGKILIGGAFTSVGGVPRSCIARLNANGSLDTGFNPGADHFFVNSSSVHSLAVQPDGKIIIGGQFTFVGGFNRNYIARLNADGSVDPDFNPDANLAVQCLAVQADGKIIIGGGFSSVGGVPRNGLARLEANGTLDAGFDPNVNAGGTVNCLAVQTDGKILIGGLFFNVGGVARDRIARLTGTGTLDEGFNPGANDVVASIALQVDEKILIGGNFTSVGGLTRRYVARLNAVGTVDDGFNPDADGYVGSMALQTNGKIAIGGNFNQVGGVPRLRLAWLNGDGSVDAGIDPNVMGTVKSLALQTDGKLVIGGEFTAVGEWSGNNIARVDNEAATQSLIAPSPDRVEWLRDGASPETRRVTFELSTDGTQSYSVLGTGSRISGGWQLAGLSLPASGHLRARAATSDGRSSSGLVESVSSFGGAVALAPEIEVEEHPLGTSLASLNTVIDFGSNPTNLPVVKVFSIRNTGNDGLFITGISKDGAHPGDFTISGPSGNMVAPDTSAFFTVTFSPGAAGTRSAAIHIASNDADESPFDLNLTGTGVTALAAFDNTIAAISGLSGANALPAAMPFGDGVENLLKYAFNMNLAGPDARAMTAGTGTAGLPAFAVVGTGPSTVIRMEFVRRKGSGLIYTAKHSTDLGTFAPMTGTTTVTAIDSQWERVLVQEPCNPATTPACFGIVEVTLP